MSTLNYKAWPPRGWATLSGVDKQSGQALVKDAQSSTIRGLRYHIESEPLYLGAKKLHAHYIQIEGWEYSIQSDSIEFPVLSFNIVDRFDGNLPEEYYVSNIKVMACPVDLAERSARKTLELFNYFVRQVERNKVPDIDRIMRIYRLHPVSASQNGQRTFYSTLRADIKKATECCQSLLLD